MAQKGDLDLRKFVAPEFVFGCGARNLAGRYAKNFGANKVLVVSDKGVADAGWMRQIIDNLDHYGIQTETFIDISPNPRAEEVMAGAEIYLQSHCQAIVAVGGGSPIDCAKGIGLVTANGGNILDFEGVDRVAYPLPPLVCVPTTSGTSADISQFSIIRDVQRGVKIAIISKTMVPDAALIDPVTLTSMPAYLTACTGMDALVHAIEAYVSNASSPITDLNALEAIRLMSSNLPLVLANPGDLNLRTQVMLGSLLAGMAFSNASLGAVHAMSHAVGGMLDLPHGECNAILLPQVVARNFDSSPDRYLKVAEAMGIKMVRMSIEKKKDLLIKAIQTLNASIGIPRSLGAAGVQRDDIPGLAEKALNDPCMVTNPCWLGQADVEEIYAASL